MSDELVEHLTNENKMLHAELTLAYSDLAVARAKGSAKQPGLYAAIVGHVRDDRSGNWLAGTVIALIAIIASIALVAWLLIYLAYAYQHGLL